MPVRKATKHVMDGIADALSDTVDPWHIALITGGLYKLFCYWAETGYEEDPTVIASFLFQR